MDKDDILPNHVNERCKNGGKRENVREKKTELRGNKKKK